MITENSTGFKAFTATAVEIAAYVRVVLGSGGTISVAGAADIGIGVTTAVIAASGTGTVKLFSAPGTFMMKANAAVVIGATLYATADGEVDDTGTYKLNMISLETAGAGNDIIECARVNGGVAATAPYATADVAALTAAGTLQTDAAQVVAPFSRLSGASNAGVLLPAAAAGLVYEFYNEGANTLKIWPASGDKILNAATDAADTIATMTYARFVAIDTETWAAIGVA
jgi:hypothetical protein